MAVLKEITEDKLNVRATFLSYKRLVSPSGQVITQAKLASLKGLGIDTSQVVENEIVAVTIKFGGWSVFDKLSIDEVSAIRDIVEAHKTRKPVTQEVASKLPKKFRTNNTVVYSDINATLDDGTKIVISGSLINDYSGVRMLFPNATTSKGFFLTGVDGYTASNSGSDLKVGCQYYNYNLLVKTFDAILDEMRDLTSKLNIDDSNEESGS